MSHGLVYNTAPLIYEGQPGALSESIADVFGAAAEQWSKNQKPAEASWLVGAGCLAPGIKGVALRSMKAPGTAYNDPRIGKDPQPDHMRNYIGTTEDFGGVHWNSGIPNHAFYRLCTYLYVHSWEVAAKI